MAAPTPRCLPDPRLRARLRPGIARGMQEMMFTKVQHLVPRDTWAHEEPSQLPVAPPDHRASSPPTWPVRNQGGLSHSVLRHQEPQNHLRVRSSRVTVVDTAHTPSVQPRGATLLLCRDRHHGAALVPPSSQPDGWARGPEAARACAYWTQSGTSPKVALLSGTEQPFCVASREDGSTQSLAFSGSPRGPCPGARARLSRHWENADALRGRSPVPSE